MNQLLLKPSFTIIIPTLNESENIDDVLSAVLSQTTNAAAMEILVADGGSTDGTRERVKAWEIAGPVRLISIKEPRGLAGDVLTAAQYAMADIIVVMDADLSHPTATIADLVRPILDDEKDMVIGSRYVRGGATPDWPRKRRGLSRLGGALAWPLTDLKDPMSGFFAVRKDRLLAVDPETIGFKIGLEIIAEGGDKMRLLEVPIVFRDRIKGQTKIGLSQMTGFARRLLVLAGGSVSFDNAGRFATVGLIGLILDLLIFQVAFGLNMGVVAAHSISFICAALCNYALNTRWTFADTVGSQPRDNSRFGRFLFVCIFAFAFRGGVLAVAAKFAGLAPQPSIFLGVGVAAILSYAGNAFFVFPYGTSRIPAAIHWRVAALGVVSYLLALKLVFLGLINLIPEESYYWNYSQHLDIGYLDHPPMVAWLIWGGTRLFGDNEFGVRIGAYIAWFATAFFTYQLTRNLFDKSAAFVGVLLVACLPFFFSTGFIMTPDAPLTAAWAAALYFIERALIGGKRKAWWGVGVAAGLGMMSKYTIALLGPAVLLFLILDPRARRWLVRPQPYLAAVLAALMFSPVIYWNATHNWASFAFQSSHRLQEASRFGLPALIASALVILTPTGLLATVAILLGRSNTAGGQDERARRGHLFTSLLTLLPLAVFVASSLFHESKPNWTGPLWLAVVPSMAAAIVSTHAGYSKIHRILNSLWAPTVLVTLAVYGLLFNYVGLGLPLVGYPHNIRTLPIAWDEFGRQVAEVEQSVTQATGKDVLLIGMDRYFVASEMAFYARPNGIVAQNSVGIGAIGQDSLMYGYWFKPSDMKGHNALVVAVKRSDLEDTSLPLWFSRLDDIQERKITKRGVAVGSLFYRIGYDLHDCASTSTLSCSSPDSSRLDQ